MILFPHFHNKKYSNHYCHDFRGNNGNPYSVNFKKSRENQYYGNRVDKKNSYFGKYQYKKVIPEVIDNYIHIINLAKYSDLLIEEYRKETLQIQSGKNILTGYLYGINSQGSSMVGYTQSVHDLNAVLTYVENLFLNIRQKPIIMVTMIIFLPMEQLCAVSEKMPDWFKKRYGERYACTDCHE